MKERNLQAIVATVVSNQSIINAWILKTITQVTKSLKYAQ